MRWLEVRRHSLTKKDDGRGRGSHLSAAGVSLARSIGGGPFAYVLTSDSPRAVETAVAMGFAVDDTVDMPTCYVPGEVDKHEQWTWPQPFVRYAELLAAPGGALAAAAETQLTFWRRAVEAVPDGSAALVVSHGGCIEPALVACQPLADHAAWGAAFSQGDGAWLGYEDGEFVSVTLRRALRTEPVPRPTAWRAVRAAWR
jgi:broad specificity phosphatase PhoE